MRSALIAFVVAFATAGVAAADPARDQVVGSFAEQRAAAERALAATDTKLADARTARSARVRAAYKVLRVDDAGAEPEHALVIARRRAAARWVLARERAEVELLADESALLVAAIDRITKAAARAEATQLPSALPWPVAGTIARRFGTFEHEKSKATLSRRGIDIDVAVAETDVVTVAAGNVVYAGPIRGLDHGVIVDHGDFLTVTAKLGPPAVRAGSSVAAGVAVGKPARKRVYFEARVEVGPGGTPIDPLLVLRSSE
jgi:septal ring factor EnvC (AmiA/AmiB activator)